MVTHDRGAEGANRLEQLRRRGLLDQLVADLGQDHRPILPQNRNDALLGLGLVIVPVAQRFEQLELARIGVDDGNRLEPVVLVEQIDRRPIAKLRYDDREQPLERRLEIERFGQNLAGLGDEGKALALTFVMVDVGANGEPGIAAIGRADRRNLDAKPTADAVGALQAQLRAPRHHPVRGRSAAPAVRVRDRRDAPPRPTDHRGRRCLVSARYTHTMPG